MKYLLIFISSCIAFVSSAQNLDQYMDSLMHYQEQMQSVQCSVTVHVEVPGINMPDKKIFLKYEKGKKPVIKSEGLLMMPKKGLAGQFEELVNTPYQAIPLNETEDSMMVKLVSLDAKSDWVTADIHFHKKLMRIGYLDITTREHGSFKVYHTYDKEQFPIKTVVRFESLPAKLPLKFLGRNKEEFKLSGDEKIMGKVVLTYSDIRFLNN